jgi:predicted nuclease of predicted toxin-antitoxin system
VAVAGLSALVYLDHNFDPQFAHDLRAHGFDAVAAQEIGMERATDEEHLRYAASARRVLISHDLKDFPRLAARWSERGEAHAGIVLTGQRSKASYGALLRG